MLRRRAWLSLALVCACPIPVPRDTVTRPAIDFVVRDPAGTPIANARVLLLTGTNPHEHVEGIEEVTTDAEGRASFTERIENITQYPLMMHGVAFYYWSWCVETPPTTEGTSALTGAVAPRVDVQITPDAADRRCVERLGRMAADRNPPRAGTRMRFALDPSAPVTLDEIADSTRDTIGGSGTTLPKTFAFDVRIEDENIVVDLGGIGREVEKKLLDAIVSDSRLTLLDSAPFGR